MAEPLDFDAIRQRLAAENGPHYWRSLEELAGDPAFEAFVEAEYPSLAPTLDRRRFLQLMAASLAFGGLAACGPAPETAVPYVEQPERIVPGEARWFASAVAFAGYAQPVLGRSHVGRPTKLEGNPEHPASRGACDAFTQAALLQLYDPDRSQTPRFKGRESSWDAFQRVAADLQPRLDREGGAGLHILLGASSSPTLARQLGQWLERWPEARLYRFEPYEGQRYAAAERAFGRALETHPHLHKAELVVSFEDDFLGPGPLQTALSGRWAERRAAAARGDGESRLIVLEASPSLTGANATERRRVDAAQLHAHARALATALGEGDGEDATLPADQQRWVAALAGELRARPGRCLLTAGACAPLDVQAAVHRLNQRLGNVGHTLGYSEPVQMLEVGGRHLGELDELVQAMRGDAVHTLLVLDGNPVYSAPADLRFADAMARVPLRIHVGMSYDETAAHSHWHLAQSHGLDGWGDCRAADGSVCLVQPLVRPFYSDKSLGEILALLRGELTPSSLEQLRETWRELPDARWREALSLGFIAGSALPWVDVQAAPVRFDAPPASDGLELRFQPDPCVWDGRLANLGWLQELPKPSTKLTWGNAIGIAPALAERQGLGNGDEVELRLGEATLRGPVWIVPGQADDVVVLAAGHGRSRVGRVGKGVGFDVTPLRHAASPWRRAGASLQATGERIELASTQMQHAMPGEHAPVRRLPRGEARGPALFQAAQPTLYPPKAAAETSWGMLIDLDQCTGCNACVVACQAENNIAVVGPEQIRAGRDMHWLRVDHYFSGDPAEPRSDFQPVPCMHCDDAPCEQGCPVNATVHGPDGLNEMVYNRCIGTRTCASYCPYKVRRFNWLDWTAKDEPSIRAARNPNVTVRSRGVMEKCTYCVQRISQARIEAGKEGREIADGEVKTACQQTCPTQAITFGNLADGTSAVSQARDSVRHYGLLEELGTRPKTTYLAAIEDPKVGEGEG